MDRRLTVALGKLGGFGTSTIANGLVGLVAIPFVVALAGPASWGGIAVAQSIAGMAVVLVAFGWGVMGPARIAASQPDVRGQLYIDSLALRLVLLAAVLPLASIFIALWSPGNTTANVCAGAAMMVAGLGGSWFYTGEGKAWRLFVVDTIPRCSGTLLGTLFLALTGNIVYFALALVVGSLVSVSFAAIDILRRHRNYRFRRALVLKRQVNNFREQIPGVLTAAASSLYMNAPLTILAGLAPGSVPAYAIADKITRFAVMAMSPLTQIAQSSVPSYDKDEQKRNIVLATKASAAGAVISGVALALLMPWGAQVLSAGEIQVSFIISAAFGLTLAAIVFSQISGLVSLMALGRSKTVAASVSIGLCVAVPLVFAFTYMWGAYGAAWGLSSSELAVALFQFVALRKALRAEKPRSSDRPQRKAVRIEDEQGADF